MIIVLEKFNLNQVIHSHNENAKSKIPDNTHFNFLFFVLLPEVNSFIDGLNQSEWLYRFNIAEMAALKKQNTRLKQTSQHLKQAEASEYSLKMPENSDSNFKVTQELNRKIGFYEWKDKQVAYLSSLQIKLANKELQVTPEQADLIKKLKLRMAFAGHSHAGLWKIASQDLPKIENYHQDFLEYLPRSRKTPKSIYRAYVQYSKNIVKKSHLMKYAATENMLLRLEALAHSNFENSDVVFSCVKELQKIKVINQKYQLPNFQDPLTPDLFCKFQEYIYKNGTSDQKKRLNALPWFFENSHLKTRTVHTKNGKIIIPESLYVLIPGRVNWFLGKYPKLFSKKARKRQLILDNQYLFAYLKTSNVNLSSPHVLDMMKNLQLIRNQMDLIDKAHEDLHKKFPKKKDKFVVGFGEFFKATGTQLLMEQLNLLEQLIEKLIKINKTKKAIILNYTQSQLLKSHYEDLKIRVKQCSARESINLRWHVLKGKLHPLLSLNRHFLAIDNIAEGREVSEVDFSDIIKQYQNNLSYKEEQAIALKNVVQPLLPKVLNHLLEELKVSFFAFSGKLAFKKHQEKIQQYYIILEKFSHEIPVEIISRKLNKYILKYFEFLMNVKKITPSLVEIMDGMELILNLIQKDHCIFGEPLADFLKELKGWRSDESWLIGKAKVKSWHALMDYQLNQRSFEKDVERLDGYIFSLLSHDQEFSYSVANIETLQSVRDQLIASGTARFNSLALENYQSALMGSDQNHKVVKDLIILSAKAHLKKAEIVTSKTDFENEPDITELSVSTVRTLRKHTKTNHCPFLFGIGKEKRGLFSQQFIQADTTIRRYHTV